MLLALVTCVFVIWAAWKIFKPVFVKSPLDILPGPPSKSLLTGNVNRIFLRDGKRFLDDISSTYGPIAKLQGPLGRKLIYVYDPAALNSIILKDAHIFNKLKWLVRSDNILLGPGLLSTVDETHRKQRKMLTPVFSIKHLRDMMPIFYEVSYRMIAALSERVKDGQRELDVLHWMGRTALELIGQAGMGHSFDRLVEDNEADPFAEAAKTYLPLSFTPEMVVMRNIIPHLKGVGPQWLRRWVIENFPHRGVQELRHVLDILHETATRIVEEKKDALEKGQLGDAKDVISVLIQENMQASPEDQLPEDEVVAQISTLLFAATDTTSNAISRILELLSKNPEVQVKLRQEIMEARNGNDLPYDVLHNLPYLDAICRETLRLYAPSPLFFRQAYEDATLPLSKPVRGTDGKMIDSVFVPKGTQIVGSNVACNRNKALWGEDADEWKPERWLKPIAPEVEAAHIPGVYVHLMTFLGGGHSCIGFKFSQMEMKTMLSLLLPSFTFELSEKPIFWNHSGISFPSTGLDSGRPELWLKVSKYTGPR